MLVAFLYLKMHCSIFADRRFYSFFFQYFGFVRRGKIYGFSEQKYSVPLLSPMSERGMNEYVVCDKGGLVIVVLLSLS